MQNKKCPKCKESKSFEHFGKDKRSKSGLQVYCKSCRKKYRQANKETIAINQKAYRQANKETIATQEKRWRQANKEGFAAQQKSYYESNKDVFKRRHKRYYEANKKDCISKSNSYTKNRYATDPMFRTMCILRHQTRRLGDCKNDSTIKIIGCSAKEFWEMNGSPSVEELNNLHIDHIIPLSWFDMTNEDHVRVASHHTNLQYLTADDNMAKSDRYAGSPSSIIAYKGEFDIDEHVQKTITSSSF
jgi:hypothetical protein